MNNIKLLFAIIGGFIGGLLGGVDEFLYVLIVFMVIDYITGVVAAVSEKKLSSEIGAKGIIKKVMMLMIVMVANLLDANIIGSGNALRTMVIFFYLANEGISIIENAVVIGLPVPKGLEDVLMQLRDRNNEGSSAK